MSKIMIVDDSGYTRKMVKTVLEVNGFSDIVEASTSSEAIAKFKKHKPDVALLDIVLESGTDGFEICKEFRKISSATKVIFLTAINQDSYRAKAKELKADAYIVKPFEPDLLIAKIKEIVPTAALAK